MVRSLAAFLRQLDSPAAFHAYVAIARHALQCRGHGGRGHGQLLGEPRADGPVVLFQHFPDWLQIVFLRYAGFFSTQFSASLVPSLLCRLASTPIAQWF